MDVCAWNCKWNQGSRGCYLIGGGGGGNVVLRNPRPALPRLGYRAQFRMPTEFRQTYPSSLKTISES